MRIGLFGCFVVTFVFAGCSKPAADIAPVQGRVTLDGKPLASAQVTFQPTGKAPGIGSTDQDGHYELSYKRGVNGAPTGVNRVYIRPYAYGAEKGRTLPERYNNNTELEREVKPGPNEFNFDLTSDEK